MTWHITFGSESCQDRQVADELFDLPVAIKRIPPPALSKVTPLDKLPSCVTEPVQRLIVLGRSLVEAAPYRACAPRNGKPAQRSTQARRHLLEAPLNPGIEGARIHARLLSFINFLEAGSKLRFDRPLAQDFRAK